VPSRANALFQPNPLVEAPPILTLPRLLYLEPGHGRSKVAAETLGGAGVLSPLRLAPLTPSLEQPIDLDEWSRHLAASLPVLRQECRPRLSRSAACQRRGRRSDYRYALLAAEEIRTSLQGNSGPKATPQTSFVSVKHHLA
jgi:hypothetical protein